MTEREKQLARREGFINAHRLASPPHVDGSCSFCSGDRCFRCEELAARLYPLPKVERPRVVDDPKTAGYSWRCVNGSLEVRNAFADKPVWTEAKAWIPHPERVAMWNGLLASPSELIDDVSLLRDGGL